MVVPKGTETKVESALLMVHPADFTIKPWLEEELSSDLSLGQVVGGTYVFVLEEEQNVQGTTA